MVSHVGEDLLAAALAVFERCGCESATVAASRTRAGTSNGSFLHFFASKKQLVGALFLEILKRYRAAILAALSPHSSAREDVGAADPSPS